MKYLKIFTISVGISVAGIFIFSCQSSTKTQPPIEQSYPVRVGDNQVSVHEYMIDSCEYIGNLHLDVRCRYLTHKGNCSNPIHR